MRRALFALAFTLVAGPALAAGWQSGMQEDEGGAVMQAWVEAGEGDQPADLRIMCAGSEGVNIRYTFGSDLKEGTELPADGPVNFELFIDDAYVVVPMQMEEMDGAYSAYMPTDAPLLRLLQSGTSLKIYDVTKLYHDVNFPLAGSSKAIGAVLASCNQG